MSTAKNEMDEVEWMYIYKYIHYTSIHILWQTEEHCVFRNEMEINKVINGKLGLSSKSITVSVDLQWCDWTSETTTMMILVVGFEPT